MEGPVFNLAICILNETSVLIPLDNTRSAVVDAKALRVFAEKFGCIVETHDSDNLSLAESGLAD
jgi:hypothetical protein